MGMQDSLNMKRTHIEVWSIYPDKFAEELVSKTCEETLDLTELSRYRRFKFQQDRHLFACAHLLLRHTLSRYHNTEPSEWQFEYNQHGRPKLTKHELSGKLQFNLSHTKGKAVVAVGNTQLLGVDVESLARSTNRKLAKRLFTHNEKNDLFALPKGKNRQQRFLELWTLKEAYIKANGFGLALSLRQFSIRGSGRHIYIQLERPWKDTAKNWHFCLSKCEQGFVVAVASKFLLHPPSVTFHEFQLTQAANFN